MNEIPEIFLKNYNSKANLRPLICKRLDDIVDGYEFQYYDGSKYFYGHKDIKEKARKYNKKESKYIHIQCKCNGKHKDLKECYNEYLDARNYLVELTKNEKGNKRKIDMNVSGNVVDTFKRLFFEFLVDGKLKNEFRNYHMVKLNEYRWHEGTSGSHQYIDKSYRGGNITAYDFNSYYTYLLTNEDYPMYEGQELFYEELPETVEYGIYLCKITNPNKYCENADDDEHEHELDYKIDYKVFKTNDFNKYTHFDILLAKKLKYNVEMITKDKNQNKIKHNAIIYTKDKLVSGKLMFAELLEHLQKLKNKCDNKNAKKIIKNMMTCSWGCLSQVNDYYEDVFDDCDEDDIEEDEEEEDNSILLHKVEYEHKIRYYYLNQTAPLYCYKSRFARIKVFMLSFGRMIMSSICMKKQVYPHVIRTHTDSIWVDNKCKFKFDIGEKIGQFKIELQGTVIKVHHLNKIEFQCQSCNNTYFNKQGHEKHICG